MCNGSRIYTILTMLLLTGFDMKRYANHHYLLLLLRTSGVISNLSPNPIDNGCDYSGHSYMEAHFCFLDTVPMASLSNCCRTLCMGYHFFTIKGCLVCMLIFQNNLPVHLTQICFWHPANFRDTLRIQDMCSCTNALRGKFSAFDLHWDLHFT